MGEGRTVGALVALVVMYLLSGLGLLHLALATGPHSTLFGACFVAWLTTVFAFVTGLVKFVITRLVRG